MGDAGPSLTGQQNAVALGHKVVLGGSGGRRTCLGEEPDGVRWSGMEEMFLVPDTGLVTCLAGILAAVLLE